MGLFNFGKKNNQEENRQPGNPTTMIIFRLLAVGYVLWIYKDVVKSYIAGGEEAPSLALVIISGVLFVGCGAWILVSSFRQYKQMKVELDEYNERVAEEYRLEEEAKAKAEAEEYEEYEEEIDEEYEEEIDEEYEEAEEETEE